MSLGSMARHANRRKTLQRIKKRFFISARFTVWVRVALARGKVCQRHNEDPFIQPLYPANAGPIGDIWCHDPDTESCTVMLLQKLRRCHNERRDLLYIIANWRQLLAKPRPTHKDVCRTFTVQWACGHVIRNARVYGNRGAQPTSEGLYLNCVWLNASISRNLWTTQFQLFDLMPG